jgi:hypothetical protein
MFFPPLKALPNVSTMSNLMLLDPSVREIEFLESLDILADGISFELRI